MDPKEDIPVMVELDSAVKPKTPKRKREGKASAPNKKPKETKAKASSPIQHSEAHKQLKFLASCEIQNPDGRPLSKEQELEMKKRLREINALDEKRAAEQLDNERTQGATKVARRLSAVARLITGNLADALLGGQGEIIDRFSHDNELDGAIANEFLQVAHLLNNRTKLFTLAGSNCVYGKLAAMTKPPKEKAEPALDDKIIIEEVVEAAQFPAPHPPSGPPPPPPPPSETPNVHELD